MTKSEKLSSVVKVQDSRLLHKYYRLLQRYQTQPTELLLTEVAETLFCSPRHARTLVKQMQEQEWVSWLSKPGRGIKGRLQCRLSKAALNASEEFLVNTKAVLQPQTCLAQQCVNGSHLTVLFDRSLPAVVPTLHSSRTEQFLVRHVHAGLVRMRQGSSELYADVAHHWMISDDGLAWTFYLRQELLWHHGENVLINQLITTIKRHLSQPVFRHVKECVVLSRDIIQFRLARPDPFLGHRLASPYYFLNHPDCPEIGLGPFRVESRNNEVLKLTQFTNYHGEKPLISSVSFIQSLKHAMPWPDIDITLPSEPIAEVIHETQTESGFTFIVFNQKKNHLSLECRCFILKLLEQTIAELEPEGKLRPVADKWKRRGMSPTGVPAQLPTKLTLACIMNPITRQVTEGLRKRLKYFGCELELCSINAAHWFLPDTWESRDMAIGDFFSSEHTAFSLAERFRHSMMMRVFLGERAHHRGELFLNHAERLGQRYERILYRGIRLFLDSGIMAPLYGYHFQVFTSPSIQGVEMCTTGWPNLTRLWVASAD